MITPRFTSLGETRKERQVMLEYMTQIQSLNPLTFNQYSETVKNGVEAYRVLKEYGLTNDPEFEKYVQNAPASQCSVNH